MLRTDQTRHTPGMCHQRRSCQELVMGVQRLNGNTVWLMGLAHLIKRLSQALQPLGKGLACWGTNYPCRDDLEVIMVSGNDSVAGGVQSGVDAQDNHQRLGSCRVLRQDRVGNIEVGKHVLDIVVVLQLIQ